MYIYSRSVFLTNWMRHDASFYLVLIDCPGIIGNITCSIGRSLRQLRNATGCCPCYGSRVQIRCRHRTPETRTPDFSRIGIYAFKGRIERGTDPFSSYVLAID